MDPVKNGLNWFVYCRNNPQKYLDPNGLDIIILNDEQGGSYGKGQHAGIIIGNEKDGWTYYSKDGPKAGDNDPKTPTTERGNRTEHFDTLEDLDKFLEDPKIQDKYDRAIIIPTNAQQDKDMKDKAEGLVVDKDNVERSLWDTIYDLTGNNCGDLVGKILEAGGITDSEGKPLYGQPYTLMEGSLITSPKEQYGELLELPNAKEVPSVLSIIDTLKSLSNDNNPLGPENKPSDSDNSPAPSDDPYQPDGDDDAPGSPSSLPDFSDWESLPTLDETLENYGGYGWD